MCWRFFGEPPRQVPGQHRVERARKLIGADLVELRFAEEERREPAGVGGQASSDRSGHSSLSACGQKHHPVPALLERVRPRQPRNTNGKNAACQRERGVVVLRGGERLLGEDDAPSRRRRRARKDADARSKVNSSTVSIALPAILFDVLECERAAGGCAPKRRARRFRRSLESLASQRNMRFQRCGPSVGHEEFAALAASDCDAVGICRREQRADEP